MKHLYEINEDWEVYAADSLEQVTQFYREIASEEPEYVTELDDNIVVPVSDNPDADPEYFGKTYAEVAASYDEPMQVWSSY